jgi:hypothetical protein
MQEVRVIARAVAQQGKGDELKALLRGLVQPTRAEAGCKYYELFESNLDGIFLFNQTTQVCVTRTCVIASAVMASPHRATTCLPTRTYSKGDFFGHNGA